MARMIQLAVLAVIAAVVAGCSVTLTIKIVPERQQQTTNPNSVERNDHES